MKKIALTIVAWVAAVRLCGQSGSAFDLHFTDGCMRLDYFHTGTDKEEVFSYDEIWREPFWAGSRTNLVDTLNLGSYQFQVFDAKTNVLIYSMGFCSIFGEWKTTDEAKNGVRRTFGESVRFPYPKRSVKVCIDARDRANVFREAWSFVIDPGHPNIRRETCFAGTPISVLFDNGDPKRKVDVVLLPDGYKKEEMWKFLKDASRLLAVLFDTEPFKSRKKDFNVRAVELPSDDSGIDNPLAGVYRANVFSCSFNSFESDRYVLTWDNKTLRKAASLVPYDDIILLANDAKYGGGGIYNLYATCASDSRWSEYVFTHEFGHSFAGLGDEYYTSDVAYSDFYPAGVEPWDPNITVCTDKSKLKWGDLVEPDVPVPTPWDKEAFDIHQAEYGKVRGILQKAKAFQTRIDSLTTANDQWLADFLKTRTYSGKTGAFEGCGYASKGLYRPFIDCRMFSRSMVSFDPVCRRSIERVIDFYSR
jgi:hypothetical protein